MYIELYRNHSIILLHKAMAKFLIESPHTDQGCLDALDEVLSKDTQLLKKFSWGCNHDFHTGWAIVEAMDAASARALLPKSLRSQSRIYRIETFTPEEIRNKHEH